MSRGRYHCFRGMRRCAMLLLAAMLMPAAACRTTSQSAAKQDALRRWNAVRARTKFQLARQQLERGFYDDAIETASESLGLDGAQCDAYVLLVRAHLELGRVASAGRVVQAATRKGLDSAELRYVQGIVFEQRGESQAAIDQYRLAVTASPTDPDYVIALAESLVTNNRASEALELLEECVDRTDDSGSVAVLAGQVAALVGDTQGAIRHYRRAMQVARDDVTVAAELGLLLTRSERCVEAVALLKPLVDADRVDAPVSPALRRALATCYLVMGDGRSAQATLTAYADDHPSDTLAQLLLAKAALATDDLSTAGRAVSRASNNWPNHSEIVLVQATLDWRRGKLDRAADALTELISRDPYDVDACCLLGEVSVAMGDADAASAAFDRALAVDPQSVWAAAALRSLAEKSSVFSPAFGHSGVARAESPEPVTLPVKPGFQGDSVGRETSQADSSGTMDPAR